jgi:hypothetical protein
MKAYVLERHLIEPFILVWNYDELFQDEKQKKEKMTE